MRPTPVVARAPALCRHPGTNDRPRMTASPLDGPLPRPTASALFTLWRPIALPAPVAQEGVSPPTGALRPHGSDAPHGRSSRNVRLARMAHGWVCGHQPAIAEPYISTGSLYLCATALLPLASIRRPFLERGAAALDRAENLARRRSPGRSRTG